MGDVPDTSRPVASSRRLRLAIDDTPTARYGPCVEGAGVHHNPTPGPAGEKFVYGHIWVSLAALARHPHWGTIALPLHADLYVRQKDLCKLPPEYHWTFQTKLELAAARLGWLKPWAAIAFDEFWVVIDGGYAKKPFLGRRGSRASSSSAGYAKMPPCGRCRSRPGGKASVGPCLPTASSGCTWPSAPVIPRVGSKSPVCNTRNG